MEISQSFDYQNVIDKIIDSLPQSICAEDVVEYINSNNIDLNGNGSGVQTVIDFFNKGVYIDVKVTGSKLSYETEDGRVKIYQQDVLTFLKSLPNASVDLIMTDHAYSGMNQKLKLGKGKIIGNYKDKGNGGKWYLENKPLSLKAA